MAKYADKKDVYLLNTVHDGSITAVLTGGQDTHKNKPTCVVDYNENRAEMDLTDQMLDDDTWKSIV